MTRKWNNDRPGMIGAEWPGSHNIRHRDDDKVRRDSWRRTVFMTAAVVFLLIAAACGSKDTAHEHTAYTCPMHPTVISEGPGTCPVCGMALVRRGKPGEEVKITETLAQLIKSPSEVVLSSVRTINGTYDSQSVAIRAQGIVAYDTRQIVSIPARVAGRLEKVYIKNVFQRVTKGDRIADIYSPELITAQRELLFLLKNDRGNAALIKTAKRKLELLGMTGNQISELTTSGHVANSITVYSPFSGYIITGTQNSAMGNQSLQSTSAGKGKMSDAMDRGYSQARPAMQENSGDALIREGDYVTAGQALFAIAEEDALRVELYLPDVHPGQLNEGNVVRLRFSDQRVATGVIDLVQPFFDEGQNFLQVRVSGNVAKGLPVGQRVDAWISLGVTQGLWVPRSAIVDLGERKIVFVKERGVFKPKQVTTGASNAGSTEIQSGIASSDEIAANGQFLIDSESFIEPTQ